MVFQELRPDPGLHRRREHRAVPARPALRSSTRAAIAAPHRRRRRRATASTSTRPRPLWQLSIGERQTRGDRSSSCSRTPRSSIFDEPRAAWRRTRSRALFRMLRRDSAAMATRSCSSPTGSPRSSRAPTASRSCAGVGRRHRCPRAEATEATLVSMMFGAVLAETMPRPRERGRPGADRPCWSCEGVEHARRRATRPALAGIDLAVRPGEIVGVAGVAGNGQRELGDRDPRARAVRPTARSICDGRRRDALVGGRDPGERRRLHPGGRPRDGRGAGDDGRSRTWLSATPGATRGRAASPWTGRAVRGGSRGRASARLRRDAPVARCARRRACRAATCSALILAREMAREPRLIVAFYPTRGLDVRSAVGRARAARGRARDAGAGVLLISEDLDELFGLSDRLVVLFRGRIVGDGTPETITRGGGRLPDDRAPRAAVRMADRRSGVVAARRRAGRGAPLASGSRFWRSRCSRSCCSSSARTR